MDDRPHDSFTEISFCEMISPANSLANVWKFRPSIGDTTTHERYSIRTLIYYMIQIDSWESSICNFQPRRGEF